MSANGDPETPGRPLRRRPLSPKAVAVLGAVAGLIDETGEPPTVRQVAQRVGARSTSTVHQHVRNLRANGMLRPQGVRSGLIPSALHRCPLCGAAPPT